MRRTLVNILILLLFISCTRYLENNKPDPIARAFNNYLYSADIKEIFPPDITPADSIIIARKYIEKWIKKQLLSRKAELNLSDELKDVEKQIEDYKASLLIFKYEQQLIKEKLDTIIYETEIQDYYDQNISNFILDDNIIKVIFIKIPRSAPNIHLIRTWYKSDGDEDIEQMEDYCFQYADKYDYLVDEWNLFDTFLEEIPDVINNQEQYLRYNNFIETQDSLFYYLVNIKDCRLKSTVAPLNYVSDNIRYIILNKRKIEFIKELENDSYNDALNRNSFEIY